MNLKVEIDKKSGFCGGVIRAIAGAEKHLKKADRLYSLGSIVHNEAELERLSHKGLATVSVQDISQMSKNDTVFIRAHGEPPTTYEKAEKAGLNIVDFTCPVVLRLQKDIRMAYERLKAVGGQLIIFGKVGHAEVLGLMGQVNSDALVISNMQMLEEAIVNASIRLDKPIEIFSQTTKSPTEYACICDKIREAMMSVLDISQEEIIEKKLLLIHDTVCSQVSNRHEVLQAFAKSHSIIMFVSGKESSNGKVLYDLCKKVNPRTYMLGGDDEIDSKWFRDGDFVGVCGATSTPKWLLEAVEKKILQLSI